MAEKERKDKLAAAVAIATAEGGSARSATPRKRPAAGEKTPQKRARGDGDGDDGDDNDFTENVRKSLAKLQRFLPADVLASAHRIVDSTRFKAYRDTSHAEPKQHFRVITIDDKKHRGLHTGFAHLLVEAGLDKTSAAPLLSADAKNLGIAGNSFLCDSRNAFVGKVKAALEEESHM